jgi:hypothetical protein
VTHLRCFHLRQAFPIQGLVALVLISGSGPRVVVPRAASVAPNRSQSAAAGHQPLSSKDTSVATSLLAAQASYTDTFCENLMAPFTDEHFFAGMPYGNESCWCPGSTGRVCTVEPDRPAYHLYEFDVPSYADGQCWTFSTEKCSTRGCDRLPIEGDAGVLQRLILYKDAFHVEAPCDPTPTGWCEKTMDCGDPCYAADPTIVESLSTGHYYLVVSNAGDIQDGQGQYWYTLHVIHPVDTDFECPNVGGFWHKSCSSQASTHQP